MVAGINVTGLKVPIDHVTLTEYLHMQSLYSRSFCIIYVLVSKVAFCFGLLDTAVLPAVTLEREEKGEM